MILCSPTFNGTPVGMGCGTRCLSLDEWMHEATNFAVLRSLRFFKFYFANKCFAIWERTMRYERFHAKRLRLADQLFFAKPLFAPQLAKLQSVLYDVDNCALLNLSFFTPEVAESARAHSYILS